MALPLGLVQLRLLAVILGLPLGDLLVNLLLLLLQRDRPVTLLQGKLISMYTTAQFNSAYVL